MDTFGTLKKQLQLALDDCSILAGDIAGPSDASWQDVAGTAAINLRSLADMLDSLRQGETHFRGYRWTGRVCFPSPSEAVAAARERAGE